MMSADDGTWETMNHHLVMLDRERTGREASPTAAVIDSQSVKTTESGGIRGYDAEKKIKGRKQHAIVDTDGRALETASPFGGHPGPRWGRPAAALLRASRARWPFVVLGYADGGYAGSRVADASPIRIEVVCKSNNQVGFAVIARRWVERFFAWINRNHRLAKEFEASIESFEAFLYAASSMMLLRRLARWRMRFEMDSKRVGAPCIIDRSSLRLRLSPSLYRNWHHGLYQLMYGVSIHPYLILCVGVAPQRQKTQ